MRGVRKRAHFCNMCFIFSRELLFKFKEDRFPDRVDALLYIHNPRTINEEMLLIAKVRRGDHRLRNAEAVDAALQHGADRLREVLSL